MLGCVSWPPLWTHNPLCSTSHWVFVSIIQSPSSNSQWKPPTPNTLHTCMCFVFLWVHGYGEWQSPFDWVCVLGFWLWWMPSPSSHHKMVHGWCHFLSQHTNTKTLIEHTRKHRLWSTLDCPSLWWSRLMILVFTMTCFSWPLHPTPKHTTSLQHSLNLHPTHVHLCASCNTSHSSFHWRLCCSETIWLNRGKQIRHLGRVV